jgi:hypothetical protein
MKLLVAIFLLLTISDSDIHTARQLFLAAGKQEQKANDLLQLAQNKSQSENIFEGYRGVAFMMLAKHSGNPFQKLKLFNKGKAIFENAISKDSMNIEMRYLRLAVQSNTPGFLGYTYAVETDKKYLSQNIVRISDTELKNLVSDLLTKTK